MHVHGLTETVAETGVIFDPPELEDALIGRMERILLAVRDPEIVLDQLDLGATESDAERFSALAAISRARPWYSRCCKVKTEFVLGWHRVHEVGARGPGRVMQITGSWIVEADGTRTTHCAYPKGFKADEFAVSVQLLLEHCALAGDR